MKEISVPNCLQCPKDQSSSILESMQGFSTAHQLVETEKSMNSEKVCQNEFPKDSTQVTDDSSSTFRKGVKRTFSEMASNSSSFENLSFGPTSSESHKKIPCQVDLRNDRTTGHSLQNNNNNNNESIVNRNGDNSENIRTVNCDKKDKHLCGKISKSIINNAKESDKSNISESKKQKLPVEADSKNKVKDNKSTDSSPASRSESERRVYGLRPRSALRRLWVDEPHDSPTSSSQTSKPEIPSQLHKSGAEPRSSEANLTSKPHSSSSKSRGTRSKPLSKYRRITANARERDRMKEINSAFATLRAVLPTFTNCRIASMTKYSTLQLAVSYIKGLSELLNETNEEAVKKENCPTYSVNGATSQRDVNLSVGISEIKPVPDGDIGDKPSDYLMFSNGSGINPFTDDHLQGFDEIENLPDMRWALDFILE